MIGCDIETFPISETAPLPKPVCIAWADKEGQYLTKSIQSAVEHLIDSGEEVVFHNGSYDLGCILCSLPQMKQRIFRWVKSGKVKDTMIREKLLDLSTEGFIEHHSLAALAKKYLGEDLEKEDSPRLLYHEVAEKSIGEWPKEFVHYAKEDARITFEVAEKQRISIQDRGKGSANTETLQVAAALALALIKANGLRVDEMQVKSLSSEIHLESDVLRDRLVELGFAEWRDVWPECPDCGNRRRCRLKPELGGYVCSKHGLIASNPIKRTFHKQSKIFREHLESTVKTGIQKTEKGLVSLSKADLDSLTTEDKVINTWRDYQEYEKLLSTYLPQLEVAAEYGIMYPEYDVLKETGRTSSYKSSIYGNSTNIQQPPRKEGVRECYIPHKGNVIVAIDYGALELCSTAQSLYNLLGWSKMKDALNKGDCPVDLHSTLGARLMSLDKNESISYNEFKKLVEKGDKEAKHFRQLAKPINLGYPGGIGHKKISEMALASYGVKISSQEAKKLKYGVFFKTFPEIQYYLEKYLNSLRSFDSKYITEKNKRGEYYEYETNGRFRTGCTYNAAANGFSMQSLAADGAKLAIVNSVNSLEFPVIAFLHDELLFEFPNDDRLNGLVEKAAEIMLDSMKKVLPDVRITVEADVMPRWTKNESEFLMSKTYWKNANCAELKYFT